MKEKHVKQFVLRGDSNMYRIFVTVKTLGCPHSLIRTRSSFVNKQKTTKDISY